MMVDLRLFGSCATGLALSTSDVDVGIMGFEMLPKNELTIVLSNFSKVLEKFKWITSIETILTANIPIIKLVIILILHFN